ncbi:hypothetical protein F5148DRAFT_1205153 [Russula earlei]|uniref:Uncharacterized protein n=1 Tax=Russula earlei TaxID=71964 RepID=A0ACC0U895_9AGAM|nr:hypothetical protein F5148DRAFT_1205153 [Russula earlei]
MSLYSHARSRCSQPFLCSRRRRRKRNNKMTPMNRKKRAAPTIVKITAFERPEDADLGSRERPSDVVPLLCRGDVKKWQTRTWIKFVEAGRRTHRSLVHAAFTVGRERSRRTEERMGGERTKATGTVDSGRTRLSRLTVEQRRRASSRGITTLGSIWTRFFFFFFFSLFEGRTRGRKESKKAARCRVGLFPRGIVVEKMLEN